MTPQAFGQDYKSYGRRRGMLGHFCTLRNSETGNFRSASPQRCSFGWGLRMTRLLAASTVLLTFAAIGSGGARAWCDDDCAEAAYERAEARAYAREEADEDGYEADDRRRTLRSVRAPAERKADRAAPKGASSARRLAQPQSPDRPRPEAPRPAQAMPPRGKVANESSSIVTWPSAAFSTRLAEESGTERRVSNGPPVGCKTYFPTVGMTLTVRCD